MYVRSILILICVVTFYYIYVGGDVIVKHDEDNITSEYSWIHKGIIPLIPKDMNNDSKAIINDVSLISNILNGIRNDQIGCIPFENQKNTRNIESSTIIIPEEDPYSTIGSADAVMTNEKLNYRQQNPLLEKVKKKHARIEKNINKIRLRMNQTDDKFSKRFQKKSDVLLEQLLTSEKDIIQLCKDQKIRLKYSHPYIHNTEFIDESVHNKNRPPPKYMHSSTLSYVDVQK